MIVAAQPEDIDEVYSLWCALMDHHRSHHPVFCYKADHEQQLKLDLHSRLKDKHTRFFIYQQQQEWAGMLVADVRKTSEAFVFTTKGYIAETIVKEKYRGQGIGKALVEAALKWLQDMGADHVELQVSVRNAAALHFWASRGFSPTTQHMILTLDH